VITVGVVVNPVAGMGGRVGLHGTDGPALQAALGRGAEPVAPHRARRALDRLHALVPDVPILTVDGPMGTDHMGPGWTVKALPGNTVTTAEDTRTAVRAMVEAGVGLVLFVGGDGTARDVLAVAGDTPILGVPSGVKMHSGVFATGPEVAGITAARFVTDPTLLGTAEVVDRTDTLQLHGVATVPNVRHALQGTKTVATGGDLAGLGRDVATETEAGQLLLLGPGTTVAHVNAALGVPSSPLGVDVVLDGRLLAADASEAELLALLADHPRARLVLGVVGGQGFLLGRGNQQISAAVLAAVGPDNLVILAAHGKIAALDPPVLLVDIEDPPVTGYRRVRTGRGRSVVLRVAASS